jgi:Cu2+-exporting ATPase
VEGAIPSYCCTGCEVAAAIIRGAGLERYYADRTALPPRPAALPPGDWSAIPVSTDSAGFCEARLAIGGLRCASCVWVTERVLQRTPGVAAALVSYASGRATVRWNPAQVDLTALVRRIAALGYQPRPLGSEHRPDHGLLLRLGYAVFAAIYLMGFYEGLYAGWWFGTMDPRYAALFRWASLALATPVALWCAEPFFRGAWSGLRQGLLHMDLPVALGVAVLYGHGLLATLNAADGYLDSLGMLVALLLAGRVLEARGRRRASEAASALAGTVPRTARRVSPLPPGHEAPVDRDRVETVAVAELRPGDRIDVGAGEEFAADGRVVEGSGQVRAALVTGEAEPVLVGPGDPVVAGTLLVDGALTVEIDAVGQDTVVHKMAASLRAAQDAGLAPTSTDRIAPWFTAATLIIAAATSLGWYLGSGMDAAVANTVAVLVVACPCGLALARPLTAAAGLGAAARRGLLLRSSDALLALGQVDLAVLDKTGTVTHGAITILHADDAVLRVAAALERYSSHPIASAIVAEAAERGIPLPQASEVVETAGHGIRGVVDTESWELVSAGPGEVVLLGGGQPTGRIRLGDAARRDAARSVAELQRLGVPTALLTGDHQDAASAIAAAAGITEVAARMAPEAKASWIRDRQRAGHRVLFAGDGLNDGPALAAATVGVAMATGSASSVLVADGIVSTDSLAPLAAGIRAARIVNRLVRESQNVSVLYNALAVAAAVAGLVNPLVAAVLMPLSSSVVIWNAARVERMMRADD